MFIEPELSFSEIRSYIRFYSKRSNTSTDSILNASDEEKSNIESYTEFWNRLIKKSTISSLGSYEKGR